MSDSDSVISLTGDATDEEAIARRERRTKLDALAAKKRKGAPAASSSEEESASDSDSPRPDVWGWDVNAATSARQQQEEEAARRQQEAACRAAVERSRREAERERAARRAHERPYEGKRKREEPSPPSTPKKAARPRSCSFARSPPPPQHFSFERESPPPRTPRGRICLRCGGPLQAVGTARANGVTHHDDWEGRAYHKKCWREVKEQQELEQTFAPRPRRITCPGCGNPCSVKTSNSAKNPNRQFYACECKATGMWTTGFVGWAD